MKRLPTNLISAGESHIPNLQVQAGAAIPVLANGMSPAIANPTAQKTGPTQAQANYNPSQRTGNPGKVTYNIKELEAKDDEDAVPLKAHWANFSFYLMASLSVILPGLFLGILLIKQHYAVCEANERDRACDSYRMYGWQIDQLTLAYSTRGD
jgi:hypothetical protein